MHVSTVLRISFLKSSADCSPFALLILSASATSLIVYSIHFWKSLRLKWNAIDSFGMVCNFVVNSLRLVAVIPVWFPMAV